MATDAGDSRTIGSMMEEHTLLDGGCGGGASLRAMLPSVPPGPARAGLPRRVSASIPNIEDPPHAVPAITAFNRVAPPRSYARLLSCVSRLYPNEWGSRGS